MEILVHTESLHVIESLKSTEVSFVLTEPYFSYLHPLTHSDEAFKALVEASRGNRTYIQINGYLEEAQLDALKQKLKDWIQLDIKGFYFADPAVLMVLNELNYTGEKRFASETIVTNSYDASVYLKSCSKVVLARELTLEEMVNISNKLPHQIETHVLGYSLMSVSKRPLVSNYLEELQTSYEVLNRTDVRIKELKRPQQLPILEESDTTSVFSGDMLYAVDEMKAFEAASFSGVHCESLFIEDTDFVLLVLGLMGQLDPTKLTELSDKYPMGKAYFMRKTNLTKEETTS